MLKVPRRERQDRGSGAREADSQKAWVGFWFYGLEDFGEAGDEFFAVGLVDSVLHCRVD